MFEVIQNFLFPKYPVGSLVLLKEGADSFAREEWMVIRSTIRARYGWRYDGPILIDKNGTLHLSTFCLCSEEHIQSRIA